MKYYHMVIGREMAERFGDTSTRKEYIATTQGHAPKGWVCVGVCGFHEDREENCENEVDKEVV